MKRVQKFFVVTLSLIFGIGISSCTLLQIADSIADDFDETKGTSVQTGVSDSLSDLSETTLDQSTTNDTAKSTTTTNESTRNETLSTTKLVETSETTTITEASTKANGLLRAEDFTIEDIVTNGPLYARREQFDPAFIEAALEYFPEIAGGNEFNTTIPHNILRWKASVPVRIRYNKDVTSEDIEVIEKIIPPMQTLTGIDIKQASGGETVTHEIYVLPLAQMEGVMDFFVPNNWGLFNYWNNANNEITKVKMAVSNDKPNRLEMNHLLMEEFIQSFGLINDSNRHIRSIFQQEWTDVQEPDPLDWLLLEFLYRPEITSGMPVSEATEILRKLYLSK